MTTATAPTLAERAAEAAAALLALALYAVVVSLGEFLPWTDPARSLTAPFLAVVLTALVGWRLRGRIGGWVQAGHARRTALLIGALLVVLAPRLVFSALQPPPAEAELAVATHAIRVLRGLPPLTTDPATVALGLLHAPLTAGRYMAGVSGGLWELLSQMPPERVVPWSRALHLLMSATAVVVVGLTGARLAGAVTGWIAGLMLAISWPSITAGTRVSLDAPLEVLVALLLWGLAVGMAGRLPTRGGPLPLTPARVLLVVAVVALQLLGLFWTVLAPLAAVTIGLVASPLLARRVRP